MAYRSRWVVLDRGEEKARFTASLSDRLASFIAVKISDHEWPDAAWGYDALSVYYELRRLG